MGAKRRSPRRRKPKDPVEAEFGPGVEAAPPPETDASERIPGGIPCAGEGCFLKPVADLVSRFAFRVVKGHGPSLGRAASSGLEMMKALRDFLDEEIALAERTASREGSPRVTKIPLD